MAKKHQYKISAKKTRSKAGHSWRRKAKLRREKKYVVSQDKTKPGLH